MKKLTHYTVRRRHTFISVLGTTVLAFLMLMSIAGAAQHIKPYELIKDANRHLKLTRRMKMFGTIKELL